MYGQPLFWRETHKQVRLFIFDGRISILVLLTLMHLKWWTFGLLVIVTSVLYYFESRGISPDSIFRYLRASFVGRRRTARGVEAERYPVDFGYENLEDISRLEKYIEEKTLRSHEVRDTKTNKKKGAFAFLR